MSDLNQDCDCSLCSLVLGQHCTALLYHWPESITEILRMIISNKIILIILSYYHRVEECHGSHGVAHSVVGGEKVQEDGEVSVSVVILNNPLSRPAAIPVSFHQSLHPASKAREQAEQDQNLEDATQDEE